MTPGNPSNFFLKKRQFASKFALRNQCFLAGRWWLVHTQLDALSMVVGVVFLVKMSRKRKNAKCKNPSLQPLWVTHENEDQSPQNPALLINRIKNLGQKCWAGLTHVVGDVHVAAGEADTVPAHFVDQIFPKNDDFLGAILNPEWKTAVKWIEVNLEIRKMHYEVHLPLIQAAEWK